MNYTRTLRAVVDWLEIEITTAAPTNLKAMRSALSKLMTGSPHAKAVEGNNNSGVIWRFRLQDPSKFAHAEAVLERLGAFFPFAAPPTIAAIEIALDDYSGGPEKVAQWYRYLTQISPDGKARLYRDFKGSGMAIPRNFDSLVRKIGDGYQIGIGDKDGDIFQHAYFKTTDDNGQKTDMEGNPIRQRARYEIRLRGQGLPCVTLDDWRSFRFEKLSHWFRFRTPKENLDAFEQMLLDARTQIGERVSRKRKGGGIRLHNGLTRADASNEDVRYALRGLSRRWKNSDVNRAEIRAILDKKTQLKQR